MIGQPPAAPAGLPIPQAARDWLSTARVKVFADGPDLSSIPALLAEPCIQGLTTNPTLLRKSGVEHYEHFARELLAQVTGLPVSIEVIADDLADIERQARTIAAWGPNVFVKLPVTTTTGQPCHELAGRLSRDGVQVNVTALFTLEQTRQVAQALHGGAPAFASIFAGRIADTGRDPLPLMASAVQLLQADPNVQLIWASPRELLNLFQAEAAGCHVITMTADLLAKLPIIGKDLETYSLETVAMFRRDALQAGYQL